MRKGAILGLILACMSPLAVQADILAEDNLQLTPISSESLATYRGGFKVGKDYVVNIGLSVRSSVNGQTVFNTQIADLAFINGKLQAKRNPKFQVIVPPSSTSSDVATKVETNESATTQPSEATPPVVTGSPELDGLINIVQVGEGNSVVSNTGEEITQSVINQHIVNVVSTAVGETVSESTVTEGDIPTVATSNVTNVIQNTLDNSIIGIDTILNIDAQVAGLIQQIRTSNKVHEALLMSYH